MSTLQSLLAPVAVSVQTAGYTVPAGRVARVTVNLEGSATFTINAALALRGTQNTVMAGSGTIFGNSGGSLHTSVTPGSGAAFTSATDQKTVVQTYTFPPGTVLNGTGTFRYVVEEYLV